MKVRATHDDAKEGLHFSRVTNALQTGEAATFLALTLDNVAAGLAAAATLIRRARLRFRRARASR